MSYSIDIQLLEKVSNHRRGKIFFPANFSKLGSPAAVRQALRRTVEKGHLVRLAKGIYLYPKKHELLGVLYPSLEEIAVAIAKRDKARIIPTGQYALNKLGLSTQVPVNIVFLTDGSPRTVKVANGTIKFKAASPKLLSAKSDTMILVIQAIRTLGKENITYDIIEHLGKILSNVPTEVVFRDMQLAPAWVADRIREAVGSETTEE